MDRTNNLDYPHRPLCSLPVNMWNRQDGISNHSFQCRTQSNVTLQPQSAPLSSHNEVYSNMNSSQTQTILQRVSSQHTAHWYSNCYQNGLPSNQQSLFVNTQNGIPLDTNGFQVATHQNFHQNSGFVTLDPPSLTKSNSICPQQNTSAHSKHQGIDLTKQSAWTYNGNVSDQQHYRIWNGFLPNTNGETVPSISSSRTTWLPHKHVVCTSKVPSNRQTAYNQFDGKTESWQVVAPLQCPPTYAMAVRQPRGNSGTTNTSSQQILPVSNTGQRNQQYKVHLNSTFNNAEEPSQQEVEHQMIARIAEDLHNAFPPNSGGYSPRTSSSSCRLEQFSGKNRIKASNMTAQPMTQISPELRLKSSKTHCRIDRPQESSVPNVCPTRNYNRQNSEPNNMHKMGNIIFPQKNVSKGVLVTLCDTSRLKKMPDTISQETEKTISTVAHNSRRQEKIIKESDSSIPSSPSRTGTRAIAVVQPVSQEKQVSNRPMTFRELLESDQPPSNNSVKSDDSTYCQGVSQKQLCAEDSGSEFINSMPVNQHDEPPSQQSETCDENISQSCESPTDSEVVISGLSSVPSIPWTRDQLTKLVQDEEKAQVKLHNDLKLPEYKKYLISMFWDGNIGNLTCKLKEGWYRDLVTCVNSFLHKHFTEDSIILSQVKQSFEKQLKNFHVLQDNDIYSEPPYKSSWLNVNEQLEDIEDLGFASLKQTHVVESHSQSDHISASHNIPALNPCDIPHKVSPPMVLEPADLRGENLTVENASAVGFCSTQAPNEACSDVSDRVLPQTEPEPARLNEESPAVENASSVEFCSNPATTETTNSDCIDPHYIFEIQVLPPETAKIIYEQSEFTVKQGRETDSQPEEVICISEDDDLPDPGESALNDTKMVNKPTCPIEEACCISKWLEKIYGSNNPSLSKCQCKNEKTFKDCSVSTPNKEETKKEDNLSDISSDRDPIRTRLNEVTDQDKNNHVVTHAECEPHTDLSQLIKLPDEEDHTSHFVVQEPNNFSSKSKTTNLSVILIKDSENKDPSSSDDDVKSAPVVDCIQGNIGTEGSMQSSSSPSCDRETGHSSESAFASCISECEENNGQMHLTTDEATKPSFQNEEQTQICEVGAPQESLSLSDKDGTERKRKRSSSHDGIFPVFKKSNKLSTSNDSHTSKRMEHLVDQNKRKPLSSNGKAVQLVLYGSTTQKKGVRFGGRNRQTLSLSAVSTSVSRPPEVLAVCFNPLKKLSSKSVPVQEHSVKRKIHEIWKRSFPPTPPKHRKKEKTQKCTFLPNLKRTATDTGRPPGSSECGIQNWNGSSKHCLSLKKKVSHYEHKKKKRSHSEHKKKKRSHSEHEKKKRSHSEHETKKTSHSEREKKKTSHSEREKKKTSHCEHEKKKTSHYEHETKKKEEYTISHNQPADKERNSGENKRHDVLPHQNVLNFCILPNTFNFKYDTNQRKEANGSVPALPDHVEGDHNSSNKTAEQLMGTWNLKPQRKYSPQLKADVPKTSSLFHEFQKKYTKKTETSIDK